MNRGLGPGRIGLVVLLCCAACATPPGQQPWYEASPAGRPVEERTRPAPLRWQWSLDRPPVPGTADVFVLDAFTTAAATVDDLHRDRRRAVCYLKLGVVDHSRPDAARFPAELTEPDRGTIRWSAPDRITPILTDRLRLCHDKGFDAAVLDATATVPAEVMAQLVDYAHRADLPVGLVSSDRHTADFVVSAPW